MQIVAITQARYSSSRLPGKVLKRLGNQTVLDLHLKRIKESKKISAFIVATTLEPEGLEIEAVAIRNQFTAFKGSLEDVLDRFYQSVKNLKPDYIVRLTSDCPVIDSFYIDDAIEKFLEAKVDYASNTLNPTLPDGMDVEIFTFKALEDAWENATLKSDREHVTPYIRECGKNKLLSIEYQDQWQDLRMTLDTQEDYEVLQTLVEVCGERAKLKTMVDYLKSHPELTKKNSFIQRNEGYKK